MRIVITIVSLLLGCVQPLESHATSSMYRAHVKQSGSLPCFALDRSGVVRRNPSQVFMVHVALPQSAPMARDGEVMWSLGLPPDSLLIQGDECIPYGVAPADADVMVPPYPLRTGVAYSVSLSTDVLRRRGVRSRVYSGDFCLSRRADGSIRVHDLWASKAAVLAGDPCRDLYRGGKRRGSDANGLPEPAATAKLWQIIGELAKQMP